MGSCEPKRHCRTVRWLWVKTIHHGTPEAVVVLPFVAGRLHRIGRRESFSARGEETDGLPGRGGEELGTASMDLLRSFQLPWNSSLGNTFALAGNRARWGPHMSQLSPSITGSHPARHRPVLALPRGNRKNGSGQAGSQAVEFSQSALVEPRCFDTGRQ